MRAALPAEELIALAHRLADAAGTILRRHYRRPLTIEQKADLSPVTEADRAVESTLRALIGAARPEDGVIGEEYGPDRAEAPLVWVLDPIDGTKAFATARPLFGTLIALMAEGVPVLGVIDQPILGDRWIGGLGEGTRLNGQPVRTRPCRALAHAWLNATAPDMFAGADAAAFARLAAAVQVTTWGGDCYAYGLAAAGWLDLVVEARLKLYDFAALAPVVAGAGGVMTDWSGRPLGAGSDGRVVAAGDPALHALALERLAAS